MPVRSPTHLQGLGNMVTHGSRQPPRKANSIYSSTWKKGLVPSAASKALRHHNTMQDWLSTDYYPDVLRGLLLIRCPSFTLHLLSHLRMTNTSCLMPGSLPVLWWGLFCWVFVCFVCVGWVGVCFFCSVVCFHSSWHVTLLYVALLASPQTRFTRRPCPPSV